MIYEYCFRCGRAIPIGKGETAYDINEYTYCQNCIRVIDVDAEVEKQKEAEEKKLAKKQAREDCKRGWR